MYTCIKSSWSLTMVIYFSNASFQDMLHKFLVLSEEHIILPTIPPRNQVVRKSKLSLSEIYCIPHRFYQLISG